jgi:O-antigen ligase
MLARAGFPVLLAFVVVDYLRPQDWIGPLHAAPIGIAAALPLAACLAGSLSRETLLDPVSLAMGAIVAFAAAWVPFATNNFWAFQAFKFLLTSWITMLAIATWIDRPARLRTLLALLLVLFAVEAVGALLSHGRGINTYFGDENDLALGLNIALPFTVLGIGVARRPAIRLALGVAAAALVAAVVVSRSRGGLVALAAAAAATALMSRRRIRVFIAAALAVAAVAALAPQTYWDRMRTMFDPKDTTREERIHQWTDARRVWRDNPWLGVGPDNVPWVMAAYERYDDLTGRSLAGRAVHSVYFTVLPEYGVVGTSFYAALVGFAAAHCAGVVRRRRRDAAGDADTWARAILAGGVAILAGGAFISVLLYPHLYYLAGLSMAVRAIDRSAVVAPAPKRRAAWAEPLPPLGSPARAAATPFRVGSVRGLS